MVLTAIQSGYLLKGTSLGRQNALKCIQLLVLKMRRLENILGLRSTPTVFACKKRLQPRWIHGRMEGLMVFPQDLGIDTGSERFADWLEPKCYASSCGRLAQLLQSRESISKVGELSNSAQIGIDVVPCAHCGSPARVGY